MFDPALCCWYVHTVFTLLLHAWVCNERVWALSLLGQVHCVKDLDALLLMDWRGKKREEPKQEEIAWEERKKTSVSGSCCRRVKKGSSRRNRQNEGERGRRGEGYWLGRKQGRKEALRCGGVFSLWYSALTDSCCLVHFYCLPSCQPDYYQGLAVGYNGTETILV